MNQSLTYASFASCRNSKSLYSSLSRMRAQVTAPIPLSHTHTDQHETTLPDSGRIETLNLVFITKWMTLLIRYIDHTIRPRHNQQFSSCFDRPPLHCVHLFIHQQKEGSRIILPSSVADNSHEVPFHDLTRHTKERTSSS
jgi:hypothetical protein